MASSYELRWTELITTHSYSSLRSSNQLTLKELMLTMLQDKGTPNPALVELLEGNRIPKVKAGSIRPKALVPGCGKGYGMYPSS